MGLSWGVRKLYACKKFKLYSISPLYRIQNSQIVFKGTQRRKGLTDTNIETCTNSFYPLWIWSGGVLQFWKINQKIAVFWNGIIILYIRATAFEEIFFKIMLCSQDVSKYNAYELLLKLSSGSKLLLTITLRLRMVLQDIWRKVVGNILINSSPSNIFQTLLLPSKYHWNREAAFGRCEY